MPQSDSDSARNIFNISNSPVTNLVGSGSIHYHEAAQTVDVLPDAENNKKVILFLASQPSETARLRLDEEFREIGAGLERSRHREQFQLIPKWAVRPRDLQRAVLEHKPYIVHFAGHGMGSPASAVQDAAPLPEAARKLVPIDPTPDLAAGLILEDQTGKPQLVSTDALAALFALFADSIQCVILNACYSQHQAEAIAQHIPFVIGMSQAIGDRAAIEFAIGFYDALGAGEAIDRAYQLARVSIQMAGIPEHLTPVLI